MEVRLLYRGLDIQVEKACVLKKGLQRVIL